MVAISGGVDSSVCAALPVAALGKGRVYGLLLPEKDASPGSKLLGEAVSELLGIPSLTTRWTSFCSV